MPLRFGAFLSMLMPPGRVAVSIPLVGQDSNLVVRPVLPKTLRTIPTYIVYDNVTQCVGDLLVERNSFRCSVPLVPFERANRSAGKKRNEFPSTAPRLPTPRGSRRAGRVARPECLFSRRPRATEAGLGSNGR